MKTIIALFEELLGRESMPQIQGKDLQQALTKLEQVGIPVSGSKVALKSLRPMQKAVNRTKVLEISKSYKKGANMPPMVVSQDNFIVDGHHRWLASMHAGRVDEMVIKIGLQKEQALQVYSKLSNNV